MHFYHFPKAFYGCYVRALMHDIGKDCNAVVRDGTQFAQL